MKWPFAMRWRLDIQRQCADDLRVDNEQLRGVLDELARLGDRRGLYGTSTGNKIAYRALHSSQNDTGEG